MQEALASHCRLHSAVASACSCWCSAHAPISKEYQLYLPGYCTDLCTARSRPRRSTGIFSMIFSRNSYILRDVHSL